VCGYYATSVAYGETTDDELLDAIRGHGSAIENGVHHRRDVSFGETPAGAVKNCALLHFREVVYIRQVAVPVRLLCDALIITRENDHAGYW